MTTEQAIELIKQGLAHLNKDWTTTVKLVEAVDVVEKALLNSSQSNQEPPCKT